jgi:arogenate dehydrogenase (NADP+)
MKIGVIGLGLIGGSIFKKLSTQKYEIFGVSNSVKGKNISSDYQILNNCDIVFVCTPMSVTLEVLDKLENFVTPETIVTDVCSLKGFVSHKEYSYKFVPSHPMAGTEFSGWENSFESLFENAKWVITPLNANYSAEVEVLEGIIEELGAEIVLTTPEEHDKAVAFISHAPMVIAQALCENIKDNKLAQVLASTGFKDTTRLALSNTQMENDMVNLNRENIDLVIQTLNNSLTNILNKDYSQKAIQIKNFRQNLYS